MRGGARGHGLSVVCNATSLKARPPALLPHRLLVEHLGIAAAADGGGAQGGAAPPAAGGAVAAGGVGGAGGAADAVREEFFEVRSLEASPP